MPNVNTKILFYKKKITLCFIAIPAFAREDWTVSLGSILVRWFSKNFTLKERKSREHFSLVVNNILDEMTNELLFQDRTAHEFLRNVRVKSFKIIKLQDGTRKLIGYFEKISDLKETQEMTFVFNGKEYNWLSSMPSTWKNKQLKKGSARRSGTNTMKVDSSQNKEKNKPIHLSRRSQKGINKTEKTKKELRKLFAKFLKSI